MGNTDDSLPEFTMSNHYDQRISAKFNGLSWLEYMELPRAERLSCYAFYRIDALLQRVTAIKAKRKPRT